LTKPSEDFKKKINKNRKQRENKKKERQKRLEAFREKLKSYISL
jgi:hypothetical protein